MPRQSFTTLLKTGGVAFLLFLVIFSSSWQSTAGFIGSAFREITAVLRDSETQWMVFLCLGIYCVAFFLLRSRIENGIMRSGKGTESGAHGVMHPTFWIAGVLLVAATQYAAHYSPSLPALAFIFGPAIGQGVALWSELEARNQKSEVRINVASVIVTVFAVLLTLASVWKDEVGHSYAYRSQTRWTGPWDNPNIFGLLMGTGIALAMGLAIGRWRIEDGGSQLEGRSWKLGTWKCGFIFLCLLTVVLMGRGLMNSYSRGAWLATGGGVAYLIGFWFWSLGSREKTNKAESGKRKVEMSCIISWLKRNRLALAVILAATGAICFWHFRQTDWHPARRALSVVNSADFSSRNRVAAWVGDLQMMAEHPWFGTGWNQPETLYEHYYLPPRLTESAAIQMNDYLMLGATLGIPALFCFGMYLWISLMRSAECGVRNNDKKWESGKRKAEHTSSGLAATLTRSHPLTRPCGPPINQIPSVASQATEVSPTDAEKENLGWLQTTCRAGAIALLIGFWFDGGLFKLPTAATFWILLELGSVRNRETHEIREND